MMHYNIIACKYLSSRLKKLEYSLKLKIKRNDWLLADTCPQAANHCALSKLKIKRNDWLLADTCPQAAKLSALFWVWEWTQVL